MGKIVAVTGAAGYLGRVLVDHLATQPWVERIIAMDINPVASSERVISHQFDLHDTAFLRAALSEHGVTNFIHAAFLTAQPPTLSSEQMRTFNVDVSQAALKTAFELGCEQVVFISSVSVYGYRSGNPPLISEDFRLWSNMVYGQHKMLVESYLRTYARHYPDTTTTIIRPSAIAGPLGGMLSPLMRMVGQPVFILSNGGQALTQALHERDAASLISTAVEFKASGTFNAAPDDSASWAQVGKLARLRLLSLPRFMLNLATRFNKLIPELGGFTRDVVDLLSESLVADNAAVRRQLGWVPAYSTLDAFSQMFSAPPPSASATLPAVSRRLQRYEP